MGQKMKDIIRSRNTHTHSHTQVVCLYPYMGRFILEAWHASTLFYRDYSLLCQASLALCGGPPFLSTFQSVSLGNLKVEGKAFGCL